MIGLGALDRFAQLRVVGLDLAPAQDLLTAFIHAAGEELYDFFALFLDLGQEKLTYAVFPGLGQGEAEFGAFLEEEGMGHLGDDARAIAGILFGSRCSAMLEIDEDLDTLGHDVVGFLALDMDDETDAAGVMLVRAVVQAFIHG